MSGKKILVIKLGALGDFIYALGPMKAIREFHRNDHITLLTTKPFRKLAEDCGYFDEIWMDEKPKYNPIDWLKQKRKLNAGNFSRVYDLQNNDRTSSYFKLFNPKPEWAGAVKGASFQNSSPTRTKYHAFYGHVETLKLAGIENVDIDPLTWMCGKTPEDLGLRKLYVLLVPGSSAKNAIKRWPAKYYRELASKLISTGYHPVILGDTQEESLAAEICDGLDCANLAGKTGLYDLPSLARYAHGAVGNDTGPMHIISITGCTSIMIFNSRASTIQKHGPIGARVKSFESDDLGSLSPEYIYEAFVASKPAPLSEQQIM